MIDPAPLPIAPEPEPDPYPFWTWADLATLVGLALPLMLMSSLIALPLAKIAPKVKAVGPVVGMFVFYLFWLLALLMLVRFRYGRPFWRSMAWIRPAGGLMKMILWGLALAWAAALLGLLLHPPEVKTPFQEMLEDPVSLALIGVLSISLGPICEELAFRGFFLPLLVRSVGPVAGVVLSAAPFALLHGFQYEWVWQSLVIVFLAGAAFGWMRLHTGSTAASALMHCGYNLMLFTGMVLQRYKPH